MLAAFVLTGALSIGSGTLFRLYPAFFEFTSRSKGTYQPARVLLHRLTEERQPAPFDLPAVVPLHKAPQVAQASALTNEAGWVQGDNGALQAHIHRYAPSNGPDVVMGMFLYKGYWLCKGLDHEGLWSGHAIRKEVLSIHASL